MTGDVKGSILTHTETTGRGSIMFGLGNLAKSVESMAEKVEAAGYAVDASYGEEYVKFVQLESGKVVAQLDNDEAVRFIEYAQELAKAAKTDFASALLAEAKPYVDSFV